MKMAHFLCLGWLGLTGSLWAEGSQDVLELQNGQRVEGRIKAFTADRIVMELTVGGGTAEVPYQRQLLERLTLGRTAEESRLLASNDPKDIPALQAFWERRIPYLGVPDSDSGEVALKLIRLFLAEGSKASAQQALDLISQVEAGDWNTARKGEAPGLRVSALLKAGQTDKAEAELAKLETVSGADETAIASAQIQQRLVRAQRAWDDLIALETEFPRWDQIPEKRSERAHLINEALNNALYPAVFHASFRKLSADGLFLAAQIYAKAGEPDRAVVALEEIIREFPEPELIPKAETLLNKLKPKT
ncbi:MAG: hypothetical protein OHK005_00170 [Candidatus Methylacidiphilales bacterium]